MMKFGPIGKVSVVVAAAALLLAGCSSTTPESTTTKVADANPYNLITPGTILATASGDQPPFTVADSAGNPTGFDIDIVNAVAKKLKLKVVYRAATAAAGIQSLTAKQIDFDADGLGVTDERKKSISFTNGVYWSSTAFMTAKASTVTTPSDFSGKRVAVVTGTVQVGYLTKIPGVVPVNFDSANAAVSALNSGTVDSFIVGSPAAEAYLKQFPGLKIAASAPVDHPTAFAVQKGNTVLSDAFNTEVGKMIADGSFMKIYKKYFSQAPQKELVAIWPGLK